MHEHEQPHSGDYERQPHFVTTHWSLVLTAGQDASPGAQAALETLCRTYWYPLYAYVRRLGHSPEDAQDLTQSFFARLLQRDFFARAQRERGRFRSFLLTALKHHLGDEQDRASAAKRGGDLSHFSLDDEAAEARFCGELADQTDAEKLFEQRWALTLLENTRARLRAQYAAEGKGERLGLLVQFLPGEQGEITYFRFRQAGGSATRPQAGGPCHGGADRRGDRR